MVDEIVLNSSPQADAQETIAVDLDAIIEVEDATADGNQAGPLAPDGIYPVKYKDAEENGLSANQTAAKKGSTPTNYVGGNIVGQIQAEAEFYNGAFVREYINSLTFSGKPTSDLHHFLNCAGNPAQNRMSVGQLLAFAQETLAGNPAVYTQVVWEAQYATGKKNKKGKDEYLTIKSGMKNFPKEYDKDGNWTGRYVPVVDNPLTGEPVNARLKVVAFFTPIEAQKKMAKA